MPSRGWAALAIGTLALSGCAAAASDPDSGATTSAALSYGPPVEGMVALAYRTRVDDAAGGQFQIKLTNTGTEEFTVVATGLDSAGFRLLPASPRETLFRPGARIDMPTPYGEAVCGPDITAEPAYAALDVVRPDGTHERVRVPMPSDHAVLTRIHDEECQAVALAEAVTVEVVDLRPIGPGADQVVRGTLQLTRMSGEQAITVTEMRGSVLYDVVPGQLPATLAADESVLAVPIEVSPATCAAHVIAETKKPFVFPLWVSLNEQDEPVFSEIPLSTPQRDLLYSSLKLVCGL